MPTDDRPRSLDNLPRWAQSYIARLEDRLDDAHKTIRAMAGDAGTGAVTVHLGGVDVNLDDDARIRFRTTDGRDLDEIQVHWTTEGGRKQVRVASNGSSIHVLPRAGNSVLIGSDPR